MAMCVFGARTIFADTWATGTSGTITSGTSTRVGIGNPSPAAQLDISSNTANREAFIINQAQGTVAIARFRQNGTTKMLITNSGQVGIGTSSPSRTLDVSGSVRGTAIEGNGIFPVTAYGAVPNNTGTDYSTAFQNALNAASATGGVVLVPPGQYTVNQPLTIPTGVTLQGSWGTPHDAVLGKGTTLRTNAGNGDENGTPFITLANDAALMGVTIYYPNQTTPAVGWTPVPFPWTIRGTYDGDIVNVTLANSYLGIDFATNLHNSHYIRDVNMTAIKTGVAISKCLDVGRLINIHIHPKFWATANNWACCSSAPVTDLINYTTENLYAFKFGFSDWENAVSCFAIWARVGMYFYRESDIFPKVEELPSGQFVNCGIDVSKFALLISEVQFAPSIGVEFSNCKLVGSVVTGSANQGPVKMTSCSFLQNSDPSGVDNMIQWDGTGTLSIASSSFGRWGRSSATMPAISVLNGAALVSNNDFGVQDVQKPVLSVQAAGSATFIGNRIRNNIESQQAPGAVVNIFGSIAR